MRRRPGRDGKRVMARWMNCVHGAFRVARSHMQRLNSIIRDRFTSAIEVYRVLLGIKSVKPVGTNELHLEYETLPSSSGESRKPVTLALLFDETTKRLEDAKVSIDLCTILSETDGRCESCSWSTTRPTSKMRSRSRADPTMYHH